LIFVFPASDEALEVGISLSIQGCGTSQNTPYI
jgi:hypothetical protein